MKDIKEYIGEGVFDKDLVQKDVFHELNDLSTLFEDADRWNSKVKHDKYQGTWEFRDPNQMNEYVCFVFGFIMRRGDQLITKTKPNFDAVLKDTSVIQYLAYKHKLDPSLIIKTLIDSKHIKMVKLKDLFDKSFLTQVDKKASKWTSNSWGYQF